MPIPGGGTLGREVGREGRRLRIGHGEAYVASLGGVLNVDFGGDGKIVFRKNLDQHIDLCIQVLGVAKLHGNHAVDLHGHVIFSGEVDLSNLTFGTDYQVGDLVTIKDIESGISTTARIWSVTESQQEDYQITANFEGE